MLAHRIAFLVYLLVDRHQFGDGQCGVVAGRTNPVDAVVEQLRVDFDRLVNGLALVSVVKGDNAFGANHLIATGAE